MSNLGSNAVNTALVTDTSRAVAEAGVNAYRDTIAAHIDNDWTAHTQVLLFLTTPFYEQAPANTHLVANSSLRLQLTSRLTPGTEQTPAYLVPALVQTGVYPPVGTAPTILRPPTAVTVKVGEFINLSVYAASATPMTYQWQKNTIDIAGANMDTYIIPVAVLGNQGTYRVKVTNSVGYTYSATAEVMVTL